MLARMFSLRRRQQFPILTPLRRLPPGLRRQAPNLAVVPARMPQRTALLDIPLSHRRRVSDTEQAQTAGEGAAIRSGFRGIERPRESFDTPIFSTAQNRLLEPGASHRVPDLDIAICATNRESKSRDTSSGQTGGWGVGKCERINRLGIEWDETTAMDIHYRQRLCLRLVLECP